MSVRGVPRERVATALLKRALREAKKNLHVLTMTKELHAPQIIEDHNADGWTEERQKKLIAENMGLYQNIWREVKRLDYYNALSSKDKILLHIAASWEVPEELKIELPDGVILKNNKIVFIEHDDISFSGSHDRKEKWRKQKGNPKRTNAELGKPEIPEKVKKRDSTAKNILNIWIQNATVVDFTIVGPVLKPAIEKDNRGSRYLSKLVATNLKLYRSIFDEVRCRVVSRELTLTEGVYCALLSSLKLPYKKPQRLSVTRRLLAEEPNRVASIDLHPVDMWLLAALDNGNVNIWNYEKQRLVKSFKVCDVPVRAAKFVPRKSLVLGIGSDDMHIRIFNYNTLERVHQFEAHSDYL